MPTILIVRPVPDVAIDFVGTDNFLGCQLATEHLLKLGHRHIAFVGGNPPPSVAPSVSAAT